MSKRKGRVPNRLATRKQPQLRVVGSGSPPDVTAEGLDHTLDDDVRLGLVGAATASLLEEIAKARTPLDAELVLCAAFGTIELGLPQDVEGDEREQVWTIT